MYKNEVDFWILILYPATLLNSFISSSSFLVDLLMFSMYSIKSFADNGSITFSITIRKAFLNSYFLIAMASTSSTMLNDRAENRHPCLVPDLKGNFYRFCLLSIMLVSEFVIFCLYV